MKMEFSPEELEKFILPAGLLISGIILGFIIEKIFLFRLKKIAIASRWEGGRVIINALRGTTFLWFIMAGVYGALLNLDFIGPKLFAHLKMGMMVILIFSITILISKLSTGFVKLYTGKILPTSIFTNLAKIFVYILGMLVLLQTMGISVTPIVTALGVGGLAVALALQDTLGNLFAGLHIIASRKVQTGDYIKLESGGEGYLEDITWRNTAIRTPQNNTIIIPNSKLASSIITNFNIPTKDLDASMQLSVSYGSDLEKVERVTIEVAKEVMKNNVGGISDFEPVVRFSNIADSNIIFIITLRGKEFSDQALVRHEFIKKLHKRYKEEGIEIPMPLRSVYLHNAEK